MISGKILRDAIISGANNINNQRSRVDELNVFPVPAGATGTTAPRMPCPADCARDQSRRCTRRTRSSNALAT